MAAIAFVRAVHPRPHLYASPDALDALVTREAALLDDPRDRFAVARALQRVLTAVADAHLVVGLDVDREAQLSLAPILPKLVEGRVFVDASVPALPLGTELLSLEGRDARALLDALAEMTSVDAVRGDVRLRQAERRFAFLLNMELGTRTRYRARVRQPDGAERTLDLPALDRQRYVAMVRARHSAPLWGAAPSSPGPAWPSMVRLDADTVLVRLPSFGIPDEREYARRVDELFARLGNARALVLDVRGNEGGLRTHGVAVLRHLLDRPFTQWTRVSTRVKSIPPQYAAAVRYPFAPPSALTGFPGRRDADMWRFEGDPLAAQMTAGDRVYSGEVVVFVDDATNSAAIEMVVGLLAHRRGVRVIGTETKGECGRHTGQMPVLYHLPKLGVSVVVSLFEIELVPIAGCEPGRGVPLDVRVEYDERHFRGRRDPYLEALSAGRRAPRTIESTARTSSVMRRRRSAPRRRPSAARRVPSPKSSHESQLLPVRYSYTL